MDISWKIRILIIWGIVSIILCETYLRISVSTKFAPLNRDGKEKKREIRQSQRVRPRRSGYMLDTPGCQLPEFDAMDKSLSSFVKRLPPISCEGRPLITYTDGEWLRINRTALQDHYNDSLKYCELQGFQRALPNASLPDSTNIFRKATIITSDVKVNSTFLRVICYNTTKGAFYKYHHVFVHQHPKFDDEKAKQMTDFIKAKHPAEVMNVVLLFMDSVSRLSSMRQLPNVRNYLLTKMDAIELKGYNKVGDNTFPNMVPLLSGKYKQELPYNKGEFFDNFTFAWNGFDNNGYSTMYAEDNPGISMFNWLKPGFRKQPSHYYLRPLLIAMYEDNPQWNQKHACYGPQTEHTIVLNYLKDFVHVMKGKPHFALTFLTRLTHGSDNIPGKVEKDYYDLISGLHKNGFLDNTVFFFMSDHGRRFGSIRNTEIGHYEESLPMAYLAFPKWFSKKYPILWQNLKINQERLTTPFDIHATLINLQYFNGLEEYKTVKDRGISLFSEIPYARTCEDASIQHNWCTCEPKLHLPTSDVTGKHAVEHVITHMNKALGKEGGLCMTLKLKEIHQITELLSVSKMFYNQTSNETDKMHTNSKNRPAERISHKSDDLASNYSTNQDNRHSSYYRVSFTLLPSKGKFESTLVFHQESNSFDVIGSISRLNKYGDQGHCIDDAYLRLFCYCYVQKV